ncbi:MAG: hypothetical protein N2Z68_02910 [Patescibacteria group bacterium]|nr:hypothetical protein [Patescibacteria group bacterium]
MKKNFKTSLASSLFLFKLLGIFVLIFIWLFSGWPVVWQNPRIPSKIQEAQAALSMSFVGSVEGSATDGNDVTLNFSGLGLQEGDLVVVAYAIGDNDNVDFNMAILSPTGYTEVADLFANDTQDTSLGVYWKIMGATPDTSVTVDGLGGTDAAVSAVAMVFRGVDPTTPMDVTPTTATALNTMHPNPPSITPVSTGVWTVIAGASGHALNPANTNNPYTFPTGYTTNNVQRPENDTSDISVGLGYRTNPANPEDPGVMTHSGTDSANYSWAAVTLALRPKVVTFNQSAYRFFSNLDSTDVGSSLTLSQDTPATLSSSGQAFRLRNLLHIGTNRLLLNEQNFKLQFAQRGADNLCDTSFSGETYSDVTTATAIAYNDNTTPTDGTALTANASDPIHGADTIVNQTYEELNNFTNSVAAISSGQDGKWDFSLKDNGAPANTTYCFRIVKADGSLLNTYSVIPQITTASAFTPSLSFILSDNSIGFGTLSPTSVRFATGDGLGSATEMAAHSFDVSTNATDGYVVMIDGSTLTSGSHTISPIGGTAVNVTSGVGTEQYGIRLTLSGGSGGTVSSPYNGASNFYALDTAAFPDQVASGTGDGTTDTYSVFYAANISSITEAGSYTSVLTYIVSATF